MKKIVFIFFPVVLTLLGGCARNELKPVVQLLNSGGINSVGPYLTQDNKGNAVLCWTEQDGKDSLYRLKYAVYDEREDKFTAPVTIPGSAGCSISAESMGKVAFKADGTVMAVYSKRFLSEKNPYAGAIYYSFSADGGKNWSDQQFLHADTSHAYGRSFFDITALKNGELAAVWLDGRFGKKIILTALLREQDLDWIHVLIRVPVNAAELICCVMIRVIFTWRTEVFSFLQFFLVNRCGIWFISHRLIMERLLVNLNQLVMTIGKLRVARTPGRLWPLTLMAAQTSFGLLLVEVRDCIILRLLLWEQISEAGT